MNRSAVAAACSAVVLGVLVGSGESADAEAASVTGPSAVRIGARVSYELGGFTPFAEVEPYLQLARCRGSNGCARLVGGRRFVGEAGTATISFKWPRAYYQCLGSQNCRLYRFKIGQRVDFIACSAFGGEVLECGKRTATIVRR